MAEEPMEQDIEQEATLTSPDVVTKYKTASDIANRALALVISEVKPGKNVLELCAMGDKCINDAMATVYNKGKVEKGVAFPTSVSLNNTMGHYSPLAGDVLTISEGDVVKVDLGAHIDGFISVAAHTTIATSNPAVPATGRKADVICAAHFAGEAALRLIKPGKKNTEVTEMIKKIAQQFKCEPAEGVLSHQLKRFVIDGNKVIINKEVIDQKVDEFEFEENEVYGVDIVMSTGEGKSRELETRTTIYKRAVDQNYLLKLKASRYVFNEVNSRFPTLPFTLRAFEDEKKARLGITELVSHGLVNPYPVLFEKAGEFVAQFKFTVLILPSGTVRLNSLPLPHVTSAYKIEDPAINAILASGTKRSKKNKKKKQAKEGGKEGEKTEAMETS